MSLSLFFIESERFVFSLIPAPCDWAKYSLFCSVSRMSSIFVLWLSRGLLDAKNIELMLVVVTHSHSGTAVSIRFSMTRFSDSIEYVESNCLMSPERFVSMM